MKQRKWTEKEISEMIVLAAEGRTNRQIGDKLGRTVGAVSHKRSDLGLTDERISSLAAELEPECDPEPERPVTDLEKALAGLEAIRAELKIATESLNVLKAQHKETESAVKTMRGLIDDHRDVIAALRQDITDVSAYLSRSALHRAAHRFHCPYEDGRGGV